MATITVVNAQMLVRKNLDEQDPNESVMYQDENGSSADYGDNYSLDYIIAKNLPEAINAVHLAAPVWLLEGHKVVSGDLETNPAASVSDKVFSFKLKDSTNFLRLVAFQANDSSIVVTDVTHEASPEGRKQLKPAIRGRKDRPRLVQLQGEHSGPAFRYYTTDTTVAANVISNMVFVQEQVYADATASYTVSRRLRQNAIDYLTAMVLDTFGDQRAQAFYQRASVFPTA